MTDTYELTFVWPHTEPNDVIVTGDVIDNWQSTIHLTKAASGFEGKVRVPWGTKVHYKFRTDGNWVLQENHPTEYDNMGNENNVTFSPPKPSDPRLVASDTGKTIVADVMKTAPSSASAVLDIDHKELEAEHEKKAVDTDIKPAPAPVEKESVKAPAPTPVPVEAPVPAAEKPVVEKPVVEAPKVEEHTPAPAPVATPPVPAPAPASKLLVVVEPLTEPSADTTQTHVASDASTHTPVSAPAPAPATEEKPTPAAPAPAVVASPPPTPAKDVKAERPATPILTNGNGQRSSISSSAPSTPRKPFPTTAGGEDSPASLKDGKGRKKRNSSFIGKIKHILHLDKDEGKDKTEKHPHHLFHSQSSSEN